MSTFSPNCTLPDATVNYVSSPSVRGSLDILWSCLSNLLLCTWAVQHLNVPFTRNPPNALARVLQTVRMVGTRIGWMLINLIFPEWMLGKALLDLVSARYLHRAMSAYAEADGIEWTLTHSFFTNLGGFAIVFTDETVALQETGELNNESDGKQEHTTLSEEENNPTDAEHSDETVALQETGELNNESDGKQEHTMLSEEETNPTDVEHSYETVALQETGELNKQSSRKQECTLQGSSEEEKNPTDLENSDFLSLQIPLRHRNLPGDRRFLVRFENLKQNDHSLWRPNAKNYGLVNQALKNATNTVIASRFNDCCRNLSPLQGNIWVLDSAQLAKAREFGIIDKLPDITEDQIKNQSKGDFVAKMLALGQSIWMVIQVIARRVTGLNSSQLEIMAVAFSVVAFMTYLCLWYKPQDVECVTPVRAARYPSTQELIEIGIQGPETVYLARKTSPYIANYSLPQFGSTTGIMSRAAVSVVGGLGGMIFGAIHCAAWSFQFPTVQERLLWRIASTVTCVLPAITSLSFIRTWYAIYLALVKQRLPPAMEDENKSRNMLDAITTSTNGKPQMFKLLMGTWYTLITAATVVYAASRLYLIVESLRSLCFLPPSAFLSVNWPISLPHVG